MKLDIEKGNTRSHPM